MLLITTSVNDTQKPINTATFSVTSVLHQIISAAVFAINVLPREFQFYFEGTERFLKGTWSR